LYCNGLHEYTFVVVLVGVIDNGAQPESGIMVNEGEGGVSIQTLRVFTSVPQVSLSSNVRLIAYVPAVLKVTFNTLDPQLAGLLLGGFCPSCVPPGNTLLVPAGGPQPVEGLMVQCLLVVDESHTPLLLTVTAAVPVLVNVT
jgi:hypothetical protein